MIIQETGAIVEQHRQEMINLFYKRMNQLKILRACFD